MIWLIFGIRMDKNEKEWISDKVLSFLWNEFVAHASGEGPISSAPFVDSSNGFIGTPNIPFLTTGAVQVRTCSFGWAWKISQRLRNAFRKTSTCIPPKYIDMSLTCLWHVCRSMSKELLKANSGLSSRIVSMMPSRALAISQNNVRRRWQWVFLLIYWYLTIWRSIEIPKDGGDLQRQLFVQSDLWIASTCPWSIEFKGAELRSYPPPSQPPCFHCVFVYLRDRCML